MSDEPNSDERINFTDVARTATQPFEYAIHADGLADRPALMTAQIDAAVAERALQGFLDSVLNLSPATAEDAEKWEEIKTALLADPSLPAVVPLALAGLTEHMRSVSHITYDLTVGYSLMWALIPLFERSGGNAFRSAAVQGMLKTAFDRLLEPTRQLYFGMEQRLSERAGEIPDIEAGSDEMPA